MENRLLTASYEQDHEGHKKREYRGRLGYCHADDNNYEQFTTHKSIDSRVIVGVDNVVSVAKKDL